jgi:DNA-binding transcriptional LysR family regulator
LSKTSVIPTEKTCLSILYGVNPTEPVMNLRRLRYFVVLAEELHFGRAAERLHIAQPGLSQQIKRLERELGTVLLHRDRRTIGLTAAGELLLTQGRPLLQAAANLVEQVRARARGSSGRLRIAYTRSAAGLSPPAIVRAFRRTHPDIELHTSTAWTARNLELLTAGEVDAAFVRPPVHTDGLDLAPLEDEELVVALPHQHPLARRRAIRRDQLTHQRVVLWPRPQGPGYYDRIIDQVWPDAPPDIVLEEPEAEQILAAVANGHGITILDRRRAEKLRPPHVVIRRFAAPRPTSQLALAWRTTDPAPALRAFVRTCRATAETA